jgi:dolichol-phosphate mannosyltransferase
VVIPAFNEDSGIGSCIDRMRGARERLGLVREIVVVDDGSADRTAGVVEDLALGDSRIRPIRGGRRGKGAAIRTGRLEARGDWRFMADADLSMPPDNLDRFVAAVSRQPVPHMRIRWSSWLGRYRTRRGPDACGRPEELRSACC